MVKKGSFLYRESKQSQITIFVVIALIIVVLIGGFFIIKTYFFSAIPQSVSPVYEYYKSCIATQIREGSDILASQGGYIDVPSFEPGSTYAPFSNQLGFMNRAIPYWNFVSGNGIEKEQRPSKAMMQSQLGKYLSQEAGKTCDFSSFTSKGYNITLENPSGVSVVINDEKISVTLSQKIIVDYQDSSTVISSHNLEAVSSLGKLYNLATQIYNYEKNNLFLENYSMDVLYTYAPVSGVVLNCSPTIWNPYDVIAKLKNALVANIGAVKINGDYYNSKTSDYFIAGKTSNIDLKNQQVSFMYSSDWPSRFEVWPTKDNLMSAKIVGTQKGLAVMGFCYAPYKFVYDMYFPVLVQIYDPNDAQQIFQFPLSIVINKNNPKEAIPSEYIPEEAQICQNANTELTINTYNVNLEPVQADIEFTCMTDSCIVGKTKLDNNTGYASSIVKTPQCVNGILIAKAKGYADKKYTISTNSESSADIVLDKLYPLQLEVYVDGSLIQDLSILGVNRNNEDNSSSSVLSVSYPYNKNLELSEGNYNLELMVYKNGDITIPSTTSRQCVMIPKQGLLGIFGLEEEKCTDITVPSQKISNIVYAGGNANYYVTPSELETAKIMKIYATSVKLPSSFEEIADGYDSLELKSLNIVFE